MILFFFFFFFFFFELIAALCLPHIQNCDDFLFLGCRLLAHDDGC